MSFAVTRYLVFGVELLWPIYATLVAMRTTSKSDDNQWLAYWVVHACMSVLEGVAHAVVLWVPLYFELKLVFVLWMTLPQTQGARMIYEDILAPRLAAWERRLRGGPAGGGGGVAAAAKAGSEREEPAGAIAAAALQDNEDRGEGGSSKVKASLRNLFHRTHKSEGAEEAGGVRGSSGGGGGGGGGTAVGEGQEVGSGGGGGVRHYSPLSAHLQQS